MTPLVRVLVACYPAAGLFTVAGLEFAKLAEASAAGPAARTCCS
ncbi:hypothetical protein ACIA5C_03450 [Actinoplanes sp. NPDC051343]